MPGQPAWPGHWISQNVIHGLMKTARDPPFWRNSLSVEAADCGAQIWLFCVPALAR